MAKFAGSSEKAQKWTLRLLKMALYKPGGGGGGGGVFSQKDTSYSPPPSVP